MAQRFHGIDKGPEGCANIAASRFEWTSPAVGNGCRLAGPEAMLSAEPKPASPMTNKDLIAYLHADLFIPELKAKGKSDALLKMVGHLVEKSRIRDGRIVLEALRTREKLGSTGIGKGIAIPHSRSTVTNELTLLLARAPEGIDYEALDEQPVHLLFMILAPHQERSNAYLPLLGKLVEVTRDANTRKRLLKAADFPGVIEALEKAKVR